MRGSDRDQVSNFHDQVTFEPTCHVFAFFLTVCPPTSIQLAFAAVVALRKSNTSLDPDPGPFQPPSETVNLRFGQSTVEVLLLNEGSSSACGSLCHWYEGNSVARITRKVLG